MGTIYIYMRVFLHETVHLQRRITTQGVSRVRYD